MQLTIDIPFDIKAQLRKQAQEKGKAFNQYITSIIQEKIPTRNKQNSPLSGEETHLFQIINKDFPTEFWQKLQVLDKKRVQNKLNEIEHEMLISMTEEIENANTERIKALVELSKIRKTDIDTLMAQLGIAYS